jgi:hypothetical protein
MPWMVWFRCSMEFEKVHPLQSGYFRRKYRRDRRPGLPVENPVLFYPRYVFEQISKHVRGGVVIWRFLRVQKAVRADPKMRDYIDTAITPVIEEEFESHEMFTVSAAASAAVEKHRKEERARVKLTAAG